MKKPSGSGFEIIYWWHIDYELRQWGVLQCRLCYYDCTNRERTVWLDKSTLIDWSGYYLTCQQTHFHNGFTIQLWKIYSN